MQDFVAEDGFAALRRRDRGNAPAAERRAAKPNVTGPVTSCERRYQLRAPCWRRKPMEASATIAPQAPAAERQHTEARQDPGADQDDRLDRAGLRWRAERRPQWNQVAACCAADLTASTAITSLFHGCSAEQQARHEQRVEKREARLGGTQPQPLPESSPPLRSGGQFAGYRRRSCSRSRAAP